jgi:hypothetical protein
MYSRLCRAKPSVAGRIHNLLLGHGLHPLARNPQAATTKLGEDPILSIELPDDEIAKGRRILETSTLTAGTEK